MPLNTFLLQRTLIDRLAVVKGKQLEEGLLLCAVLLERPRQNSATALALSQLLQGQLHDLILRSYLRAVLVVVVPVLNQPLLIPVLLLVVLLSELRGGQALAPELARATQLDQLQGLRLPAEDVLLLSLC